MASSIRSFGYGVAESFEDLSNNAPVIALGSAAVGGAVSLISGPPAAWLAARVTGLVLGAVCAMGQPKVVVSSKILSSQNCHALGKITASAGIPYAAISALQFLVGSA